MENEKLTGRDRHHGSSIGRNLEDICPQWFLHIWAACIKQLSAANRMFASSFTSQGTLHLEEHPQD